MRLGQSAGGGGGGSGGACWCGVGLEGCRPIREAMRQSSKGSSTFDGSPPPPTLIQSQWRL